MGVNLDVAVWLLRLRNANKVEECGQGFSNRFVWRLSKMPVPSKTLEANCRLQSIGQSMVPFSVCGEQQFLDEEILSRWKRLQSV